MSGIFAKEDILGYKEGFPIVNSSVIKGCGLKFSPVNMKKSSTKSPAKSASPKKTAAAAAKSDKPSPIAKALTIFNDSLRVRKEKEGFKLSKEERSQRWNEVKDLLNEGTIRASKAAISTLVKSW